MIGPGKYDDMATLVRERTQATGVILIVIGGNRGNGMACQTDLATMVKLPDLLEGVARDIRKDAARDHGH